MSDLGPDGPLPVGAFIRQAIGEGMGVTAARSMFREQGLGRMSNATFGQLYGEIKATVGARESLAGVAHDAIPSGDIYTPWAAGTPDRYASFVEVYVREPGSRDVSSRFFQYVTDDPHSQADAEAAAMGQMADAAADQGTDFEAVVLGASVTSMTRTVARSN